MRRWRIVSAIVLILALFFGLYAKIYIDYWSNKPQLKRNFAAEINAEILKIPEDQRAWPKYRAALAKLKPESNKWNTKLGVRPEDWPKIVKFIESHQDALSELRSASTLPHFGYLLSDEIPVEDRIVALASGRAPSENPMMITIMLVPQQELPRGVVALLADAKSAADRHDGARVVADAVAIISMASHLRDGNCFVAQLVALQTFNRGQAAFENLLLDDPTIFSDQQLAELDAAVAGYLRDNLDIPTDFERMSLEDIEQRCFTDDGRGNGYAYPEHDYWEPLSHFNRLFVPLVQHRLNAKIVSRREYHDDLIRIFELLDRELAMPPWEVEKITCVDEIMKLKNGSRFHLLGLMFPAVTDLYYATQKVTLCAGANRVAIALRRYHLRHNHWPKELTELVPEFLDAIPPDRFDGQPLRYRLDRGQPVIYSVGLDGVDDLGLPMKTDSWAKVSVLWPIRTKLPPEVIAGDMIIWPESKVAEAAKVESAKEWLLALSELMASEPVTVDWSDDEPEAP